MNSYFTGSQTWDAIRGGVYVSYGDGNMLELGDVKYQGGDHNEKSRDPHNPVFNRMHPQKFDSKKFTTNWTQFKWTMEFSGLPFQNTYVINVEKP